MSTGELPSRASWKQQLAPYLQVDHRRSLGQIASAVLPYLAVWVLAVFVEPSPPVAVLLGLIATVFLTRMYSLFHDLTHNSMFDSLVAAPAQHPSCAHRRSRRSWSGRDQHDDGV
jgi:fatty acid desaturase